MPHEKSNLILKIVAPGPAHAHGIAQRIRQISYEILEVQQRSPDPALSIAG